MDGVSQIFCQKLGIDTVHSSMITKLIRQIYDMSTIDNQGDVFQYCRQTLQKLTKLSQNVIDVNVSDVETISNVKYIKYDVEKEGSKLVQRLYPGSQFNGNIKTMGKFSHLIPFIDSYGNSKVLKFSDNEFCSEDTDWYRCHIITDQELPTVHKDWVFQDQACKLLHIAELFLLLLANINTSKHIVNKIYLIRLSSPEGLSYLVASEQIYFEYDLTTLIKAKHFKGAVQTKHLLKKLIQKITKLNQELHIHHFDMKPDNILVYFPVNEPISVSILNGRYQLHIIDFGWALLTHDNGILPSDENRNWICNRLSEFWRYDLPIIPTSYDIYFILCWFVKYNINDLDKNIITIFGDYIDKLYKDATHKKSRKKDNIYKDVMVSAVRYPACFPSVAEFRTKLDGVEITDI